MKIGDSIPDFTLTNTKGEKVTFSDIHKNGKTLILFFPLAFSSVCTAELCSIRDNLKLFKSLSTNIIAISVDSSFTLREFKRMNNLSFNLLSDFNKVVSKKFGVLYEDYYGMKGVSKRSAFVITREGVIEYAEILEDDSNLPNFKAIQEVLVE